MPQGPLVDDSRGMLRLHFGRFDVQSEMRKAAPYELVLRYTRTMATALERLPDLRTIGIIGLGGGSLAKYCYRRFPLAKVTVSEIDPRVVALRKRFAIPDDHGRFEVSCEDGAHFVRRHEGHFDALLVDGFDHKGQPAQLCSRRFYKACHRALRDGGLLVANLCANGRLVSRIGAAFDGEVSLADADNECFNSIAIAVKTSRRSARHQDSIHVANSA